MKNRKNIIIPIALSAVLSFSAMTTPVYGATHQLYTTTGFINLLISKGIISESKVEKARELLNLIENNGQADFTIQSDDGVEVAVSQFVEHGDLTYSRFEDIAGLLLTVKNTSDKTKMLTAKRNYQVVYRIYDESDTLVFDYADESKCQTSERVTYALEAGKTRVFPITHKVSDYTLIAGTYRVEIEYPEYGKGERTITIH